MIQKLNTIFWRLNLDRGHANHHVSHSRTGLPGDGFRICRRVAIQGSHGGNNRARRGCLLGQVGVSRVIFISLAGGYT